MDPWKHEDRPSLGCESLISFRTLRCGDHDRIYISFVNGINNYVTEASEEILVTSVDNRGTGKQAEPRPKPTLTLSLASIPYRERKWMDVEPGKFSQVYFEVSKFMIKLLRPDDTVYREDDGAARFDDLADMFKSRFAGNPALAS